MPELINILFDEILSKARREKVVVYFLPQVVRIGHLVMEMHALVSVYPLDEFQVIAVVPDTPDNEPAINPSAYKVSMRGVDVIVATNEPMRQLILALSWSGVNKELIREFSFSNIYFKMIFGIGGQVIRNEFTKMYMASKCYELFTLDDEDISQGRRLESALGLDPNSEVVTLHVRESGYLADLTHLSHRNASIANYVPAVEFLLREGYVVVRLGDPSMTPFPLQHPRLVDAPHHPAYQRHGDVYFSARSAFMVQTLSGPTSLALAFGRPSLASNATPIYEGLCMDDVLLPKTVRNIETNRALTLQELVTGGMIRWGEATQFEKAGVRLEECAPDALLEGVVEMHERHRGTFHPSPLGEQFNSKYLKCASHLHRQLEKNDSLRRICANYYSPAVGINFSESFIKRHPDFLDGEIESFKFPED